MNEQYSHRLCEMMDADQQNIDDLELRKRHTDELKAMIQVYGFPTISLVGKRASFAGWLIAQHSDHDAEFQWRYISLLSDHVHDVDKRHIGYLVDRVLRNAGYRQVFGTQFDTPIYDEHNVDTRRALCGMEPLVDYLAKRPKS